MAAALTASSSWSPERRNVMNDDLASFGQNATSPWRAKMALTRSVHVEGDAAACGSPGAWKRKPPSWMPASSMYRSSHGVMLALMVVRVAPKTAAVLCAPG
eukprot:1722801-Prymnesium_polylepis.1